MSLTGQGPPSQVDKLVFTTVPGTDTLTSRLIKIHETQALLHHPILGSPIDIWNNPLSIH